MKSTEHQLNAVLFDLGGTLVRISNTDIAHVMRRILKDRGITRSSEEITQALTEAEKVTDFQDLARLFDDLFKLNIIK